MFDDTHIFAPCVVREPFAFRAFRLYYCGSRGMVAERVFSLGLATSNDGRTFERVSTKPIFELGDERHSVLTPTLLRGIDGGPVREGGKMRMWFSSADLADASSSHTLHETTSSDGFHWSSPSSVQLENVYAPTILKEEHTYRLWYVDVTRNPWVIRAASSADGSAWEVVPNPVLVIDQPWERDRLFYPVAVKCSRVYLMWYGSYWSAEKNKTALGFAASEDGLQWHKCPHNPVLRPDERRPWESHYTTSQSVIRLPDGTWRIWYASRKAPPFVNKYFALNTATWSGPQNER
jgi:hypothetical protein